MREISITRALQTLKLLDDKINKAMSTASFIEIRKNSIQKVKNGTLTLEEYEKDTKASFKSIIDLIEQRKVIKSAIVKSNAECVVKIAGKEYTVADAIERKTSIEYEVKLLNTLKRAYSKATSSLEGNNGILELNNQKLIETMVGSDKNNKDVVETAKKMADARWEAEHFVFADPLKIADVISGMEDDIIEFQNEVDMCLSEANSRNTIELAD